MSTEDKPNHESTDADGTEGASFERLFEMSIDMMCIAGFDGYFKRINSSWSKVLGFTTEQLCARPFVEFVHPDDVASTIAVAGNIGQGGVAVTFENRYRTADGKYRWLQWSAGPDSTRQLIYAVARDITELKRLERQQQEQLGREAHQQGSIDMASGILHDLGNALTGMGTRAVELQTKLRTDSVDKNLKRLATFLRANEEALTQTLGSVKSRALAELAEGLAVEHEKLQRSELESADKLLAFIGHGQDLVTTYRGYSGAGVAPSATNLSIHKLVLDAQLMMNDGIGKRGATVDMKCDPTLPVIIAERTKVMQVLINLLKNAAESFDEAPTSTMRPHISIVARHADGGIAIDIRDNGCGFDADLSPRVFQDGFSTKGRGSGLGLGATRRVVQSLGGKLSLTSEGRGKGATATVWLLGGKDDHATR